MKKSISGTTITFTFTGDLAPVVFDATKAATEMRAYAEMHGWQARIGDHAAIQKSADNNYTVTEEMRRNAVLEMVNHYEGGINQWGLRVAGAPAKPVNLATVPEVSRYMAETGADLATAIRWFAEEQIRKMTA